MTEEDAPCDSNTEVLRFEQATMFEGKGKLWRQVEEAVRQLKARQGQPLSH